jgi:antitoxin ParD1/3/4
MGTKDSSPVFHRRGTAYIKIEPRPLRDAWILSLYFEYRHKLSYYEAMPMTSLNISLPEALKDYVEVQVASGDWGTPSEYVRELIRQDKERRLGHLEQELLAAAKGPKIEIPLAEIRRKGLIAALRERTRR